MTPSEAIDLKKQILKIINDEKYEEKINHLVENYSKMETKIAFRQIVLDFYRFFGKDLETFYEKLEKLDTVTIDGISISSDMLKAKFAEWIGENKQNKMTIAEDHKVISKTLPWLLEKLQENNVDYYLAGHCHVICILVRNP